MAHPKCTWFLSLDRYQDLSFKKKITFLKEKILLYNPPLDN